MPSEKDENAAMANNDGDAVKDLLFLVPLNDLEALAVADLVKRAGYDPLELKGAWGERPVLNQGKDEEGIAESPVSALLVELPDLASQATVEELGHHAVHVDHHLYARANEPPLEKRNPLSLRKQLAYLIGAELDDRQRCTAANDHG